MNLDEQVEDAREEDREVEDLLNEERVAVIGAVFGSGKQWAGRQSARKRAQVRGLMGLVEPSPSESSRPCGRRMRSASAASEVRAAAASAAITARASATRAEAAVRASARAADCWSAICLRVASVVFVDCSAGLVELAARIRAAFPRQCGRHPRSPQGRPRYGGGVPPLPVPWAETEPFSDRSEGGERRTNAGIARTMISRKLMKICSIWVLLQPVPAGTVGLGRERGKTP
jgi:hypothetical protein